MIELREPNKGQVNITDDVIATIALTAAKEVKGAHIPVENNLAGSITDNITEFVMSKKSAKTNRWIKVESAGKLEVTINIEVMAGHKVLEVSKAVQEKAQHEIEIMTGLNVFTVNVNVIGITL